LWVLPFCSVTILGVFQVGAMVELVIQVQQYATKISEESADKKLWLNKVLVIVASLILAVGGAALSVARIL